MVTIEDIEAFYDNHPNNTTPNFIKNHKAPVLRLLSDCLEIKNDIVPCLKPVDSVVKRIKQKWSNPNTLKFYLQALLFLVDQYPSLKEKVNRQKYFDAWEASKIKKAEFDEAAPKKPDVDINEIQTAVDKQFGENSIESLYISMYREAPVRLDYQNIFVYGSLNQVPEDTEKYLVLQSKTLFMRNYNKTSKKYGTKEAKLSPELMTKVKASLKKQPREQLFIFSNNNPSKAISNILRKSGIDGGSLNTLRHSVMSQDMSPEERVQLARVAGHAPTTSVAYKRQSTSSGKMVLVPNELLSIVNELIADYPGA
jgi:hypothetical protein